MEREEADEETLSDADWAAIRAAVPSFAETWGTITQDSSYDGTLPFVSIHELAKHIVEKVSRERPEEIDRLADALEYEFTIAALYDRERYAGLLCVGLLEGLIEAADSMACHSRDSSHSCGAPALVSIGIPPWRINAPEESGMIAGEPYRASSYLRQSVRSRFTASDVSTTNASLSTRV